MQRRSRLGSTQVPSLYNIHDAKNIDVQKKSLSKRDSKTIRSNIDGNGNYRAQTNIDIANERNMPSIQGASIQTLTAGRSTNNNIKTNQDLQMMASLTSGQHSMERQQKYSLQSESKLKSRDHDQGHLLNSPHNKVVSPLKQQPDGDTRNIYGVRVVVEDKSIDAIASSGVASVNIQDKYGNNKLLTDRAFTLKQTTLDHNSQRGVNLVSANQVTRIGQRQLFHSHQSTSQYTDGESDQALRVLEDSRLHFDKKSHKNSLGLGVQGSSFSKIQASVASHYTREIVTTENIGTDVKSIPATITRLNSGETTQQEMDHIEEANYCNQNSSETLMGYQGQQKTDETAMSTVHLQELYQDTAPAIVLLLQDKNASPNNSNTQLVAFEQMRASLNIKNKGNQGSKTTLDSKRASQRSLTQRSSIYNNANASSQIIVSEDGTQRTGKEAQLTQKALEDYKRKKNRLMKNRRVFGDHNIAQIDEMTQKRTSLIASLLGNTREAREIQESYKRMIEVPQEEFNLNSFKDLTAELRNKVRKPAAIYKEQLKINPKHVKKLSTIEDFVTVLPRQAESNYSFNDQNADLNHQTFQTSIQDFRGSENPRDKILTITDNALLAIKDENNAMHLEEEHEDDGNTFITNMVQPSVANVNTKKTPTLPNIGSKQHLNTKYMQHTSQFPAHQVTTAESSASQQHLSSTNQRQNEEYQLMPVIESAANQAVHDYRNSIGSLALQKTGDRQSINSNSLSHFTPSRSIPQQNTVIVPFQTEIAVREPSDLSFNTVGSYRQAAIGNGTGTHKRGGMLGQPPYRQSTLKQALGKESRVLQQIYKRVQNFQKKEDDGSKLGYVSGMIEIYQQMKRNQDPNAKLKTSQYRKQSMPLMPNFEGQQHSIESLATQREPSLQPLSYEEISIEGGVEREQNSITLVDSRKLTYNDARRSSAAQLHIVDGYPQVSARELGRMTHSRKQLDDQSQLYSLQTHRESIGLKPWDAQQTILSPSMKASSSAIIHQPMAPGQAPTMQKQESIASKRFHNQTMLNQYKQRRTLVSNLQISKLIRKDTSFFTGSAKQIQMGKITTLQPPKINRPSVAKFGKKRNTLLDETSEDSTRRQIDINELFRPLGSQLDVNSQCKKQLNINMINLPVENTSFPVRIPQVAKDAHILRIESERNSQGKLGYAKSFHTEESKQMREQYFRSAFDKTPHMQASIIGSSNVNSSPAEKSLLKRDRSDNIQNEMNEYYRSLNVAARNSGNKLSKVVIRGKNILETTNFVTQTSNDLRQGTQMIKQGSIDSSQSPKFYNNDKQHTPIIVHIDQQVDENYTMEQQSQQIDQQSSSTDILRQPNYLQSQLPIQAQSRRRVNGEGLIQLRSSETIENNSTNLDVIIIKSEKQKVAAATANQTFMNQNKEGQFIKSQNADLQFPTKQGSSGQKGDSSIDPYGTGQETKHFGAIYNDKQQQPFNSSDQHQLSNSRLLKGSHSLLQQQPINSSDQHQLSNSRFLKDSQSLLQHSQSQQQKHSKINFNQQKKNPLAQQEAHRVNIDSPFFPGITSRKLQRSSNKAAGGSQEAVVSQSTRKNNNPASMRRIDSQQSQKDAKQGAQTQMSSEYQLHGSQQVNLDIEGIQLAMNERQTKSRASSKDEIDVRHEKEQKQGKVIKPETSSEKMLVEPWQIAQNTTFDANMMASNGTMGLAMGASGDGIQLNQTLQGQSKLEDVSDYKQKQLVTPTQQPIIKIKTSGEDYMPQSFDQIDQRNTLVSNSENRRVETQGIVDSLTNNSHQHIIVTEAASPKQHISTPNKSGGSQLNTPKQSLKLQKSNSKHGKSQDNLDLIPVISFSEQTRQNEQHQQK